MHLTKTFDKAPSVHMRNTKRKKQTGNFEIAENQTTKMRQFSLVKIKREVFDIEQFLAIKLVSILSLQ